MVQLRGKNTREFYAGVAASQGFVRFAHKSPLRDPNTPDACLAWVLGPTPSTLWDNEPQPKITMVDREYWKMSPVNFKCRIMECIAIVVLQAHSDWDYLFTGGMTIAELPSQKVHQEGRATWRYNKDVRHVE